MAAVLSGLLVVGILTHAFLTEQRGRAQAGLGQGNARRVAYPGHKSRASHGKPWPIIATDWAVSIGKVLGA